MNTRYIMKFLLENWKKNIFVFVFLEISSAVFGQTLKDAIRLTVNEQFEEATSTFRALVQKEPANATNYYYFGKNYIDQEDLDSARIIFQKGTEIDAKNPLNFIGLGEVLLNDAKISESKTKYEKSLKAYNDLKAEYDRAANKTQEMQTAVQVALATSEKAKTEWDQEKVKIDQANVQFEKALTLAGSKNSVAFIAY